MTGGLEHCFFHILGMSSSQLTHIFQRGGSTTNQTISPVRFPHVHRRCVYLDGSHPAPVKLVVSQIQGWFDKVVVPPSYVCYNSI